jgi:hypothetical protein
MYNQRQQQKIIPKRPLSEAETRRYFSPRQFSIWTWIILLLGLLLITMSYNLLQSWIVFSGGMIVLLGSIVHIILTFTGRISDKQYDSWVEDQAEAMYYEALQTLGLYESDLSDPVQCIHSFVLPGSRIAEAYPTQEMHVKRGKDDQLRYSVHVYTYFFFTRNSLAIFKGDINAWNHSEYDEKNYTFMRRYQHIMDVVIYKFQDTVRIEDKLFQYTIEQCHLELTNGRTIPLSAALRARRRDRQRNVIKSLLPETGSESTLRDIRTLLFSKTY